VKRVSVTHQTKRKKRDELRQSKRKLKGSTPEKESGGGDGIGFRWSVGGEWDWINETEFWSVVWTVKGIKVYGGGVRREGGVWNWGIGGSMTETVLLCLFFKWRWDFETNGLFLKIFFEINGLFF